MIFRIIILILLTGCSASTHLKLAKRHLKKAEIKGAIITADTVFVKDSVFVPQISYDTVSLLLPGDSIVIEKTRLKVVVKRIKGDTVKVFADVKPMMIIRNIPVQVIKEIKAPPAKVRWWMWLCIGFVLGIIAAILLRR